MLRTTSSLSGPAPVRTPSASGMSDLTISPGRPGEVDYGTARFPEADWRIVLAETGLVGLAFFSSVRPSVGEPDADASHPHQAAHPGDDAFVGRRALDQGDAPGHLVRLDRPPVVRADFDAFERIGRDAQLKEYQAYVDNVLKAKGLYP